MTPYSQALCRRGFYAPDLGGPNVGASAQALAHIQIHEEAAILHTFPNFAAQASIRSPQHDNEIARI